MSKNPNHESTEGRLPRVVRWQAISGLVFAMFLSLHLLNVMASVFGPDLYDAFQVQIRPIYQYPLIELGVLLAALLVHIGAGVIRIRQRPPSRPGTPRWSKLPLRTRLHRGSAYFLLLVIFGHIAATRLPTLIGGFWLGFAGVAYAMVALPAVFYPYYLLLAVCGFYHGGYGTYLALRTLGVRLPSVAQLRWRVWAPLALGVVLLVLGVLSFGGLLYPIEDPNDSEFARFAQEYFGLGG